jgi:RNA polymerase sigma-70 factor (ECF subfamily)
MANESSKKTSIDWQICMEQVQAKNQVAFRKIFDYFSPKIKQFAMKYLPQEQQSMEIAQETMMSVWHKSHLYDPNKSALSTWIYTIARNRCFDVLRQQKNAHLLVSSDDVWPESFCPPDSVELYTPEQNILKAQIVRLLHILPDSQREVVKSVYLEEMPHQKVADKLHIPLGTVKSRLRLGLEKLSESMKGDLQ